jgi:hypothetical protein
LVTAPAITNIARVSARGQTLKIAPAETANAVTRVAFLAATLIMAWEPRDCFHDLVGRRLTTFGDEGIGGHSVP